MVVKCEVQHCADVGKCGCCTEGVPVHTEGVCGSGRTTPLILNLCTRRLGDPKPSPSRSRYIQTLCTRPLRSPAVLVPRLDLCVRKAQLGSQLHPILHTQVLLPFKAFLQGLQLVVRKRRPGLPLLLGQVSTRVAAFTPARCVLILVACNMKHFVNHPVLACLSPASDLFHLCPSFVQIKKRASVLMLIGFKARGGYGTCARRPACICN